MESWKSEDYFDRIGENPFRFVKDDDSPKEGAIPDAED